MTNLSWPMSMSSSSPAIISSPVSDPVPCLIAARQNRRRVVGVDLDPRVDLVLVNAVTCERVDPGRACLAG